MQKNSKLKLLFYNSFIKILVVTVIVTVITVTRLLKMMPIGFHPRVNSFCYTFSFV